MNIRPRNDILKFYGGGISTVTLSNPESDWFSRVGNGILAKTYENLKTLYDKWEKTRDYGAYQKFQSLVRLLNEDLKQFAQQYWKYRKDKNTMFNSQDVTNWQQKIKDRYPYVNDNIENNWSLYSILSPKPNTGDSKAKGWTTDGYWAAITNDRTPLGYRPVDETNDLKNWRDKFAKLGLTYDATGDVMFLDYIDDPSDYPIRGKDYKDKRLLDKRLLGIKIPTPQIGELKTPDFSSINKEVEKAAKKNRKFSIPVGEDLPKYNWWKEIGSAFQKTFSDPNIISLGRLAGNLINNDKIYDEALKGIRPVLRLSYNTYRQVVGDEATKQAYYRRAALGQTKAAQPFTSDADKQMAYLFEAKRIGDELRAQGDLADNQEIRRTSDESNQHLWANTQRATEVANANLASINQANSLKLNLLALKRAAQWSSVDNYLKELLTNKEKRLLENLQIEDQIFALTRADEIANDKELLDLKSLYDTAIKKPENLKISAFGTTSVDYDAKEIKDLISKINSKQRLLRIDTYRKMLLRGSIFAKSGTKITRKDKDDLLYKSAKDVVEHFRKMSKMSSDALNRKTSKIEKLTPHPKGKTRRYLQGGLAPFLVYTPVVHGGETSTSRSTSSTKSSKEDDSGKETLDLVKSLFKEVLGKGLPVDVNAVYSLLNDLFQQQKLFGEELDTNDIALMYLKSMQSLNNAIYSKEVYDKAKAYATQNDALNEYAVNALGHFVVQDTKTGKLSTEKSWEDVIKSGKNPITNLQLLNLRAYNPDLVSHTGDAIIENVVNNGMGINKIGALIKALAGNIGSYEGKIEGLTLVESNKVKSGLLLLANAPDGYYKHTVEDKNQESQIKAAISYITNMLSPSLRAILEAHGGAENLIPLFLTSQENRTHNVSILPLTGKGAKSSDGSSKSSSGANNSAGLAFVLGLGPRELISFNTGTSNEIEVLGIKGVLQTKSNENLGQGATLLDATKSQQGGYLQWNKATFGGSRLNPSAYNHIILNDSTIIGVDLPFIKDLNGNEVPNFLILRKMELADEEIRKNNITDFNAINLIYNKYGLDPKYTSDGKLNLLKYRRFAAILATLDEQSLLNKEAILSDEVALAGDIERDLYVEAVKKSTENKNYDLSDGMWITEWGRDNLYKGTIFIPYDEDIAFAALSSGLPFDLDLPDNVALVLLALYAPKTLTYKAPTETLSQIK